MPVIAASTVFFASIFAMSMLGSVVPEPPTGTTAAAAGRQREPLFHCFSRKVKNNWGLGYYLNHLGQLFELNINGINVVLLGNALLTLQQSLKNN